MAYRLTLGLVAALLLLVSVGHRVLAADQAVRGAGRVVGTQAELGFWGRPFPIGYNWSLERACSRYEPVESDRGTRMERVWVCDVPRGYAYR